jgi:hypothetical protein
LQITDQPARRPAKGPLPAKFRSREILLCLYKPKNAAQVEAAKAWLQVALNIADLESRPNLLKPDVSGDDDEILRTIPNFRHFPPA